MIGSTKGWILFMALVLAWNRLAYADIPLIINHQGVVKVDGVAFDGNGLFKFGIRDSNATWLWTNDGTHVGESIALSTPDASVSLLVNSGAYAVGLGNESIVNMTALSSTVFETAEVFLRVFFDDGVNGEQLLAPDQQIASGAYAFRALVADFALDAGTVGGVDAASLDDTPEIASHAADESAHHAKTIDAAELTTGTLPDARLSANVSLLGLSVDLASEVTGLLPEASIADDAVTAAKIADQAVTMGKLATDLLEALVPPGTIVAFAGVGAPNGWLLCDGKVYAILGFERLHTAIGEAWGDGGDGPGAVRFNVPDLRGLFLRGVDDPDGGVLNGLDPAGRDPNADIRIALQTGGNTGNEVGSFQDDLLEEHRHDIKWNRDPVSSGGIVAATTVPEAGFRTDPSAVQPAPVNAEETRPKNAYVNFIIKT